LAKQGHGYGGVDLAKQSQREAREVLAEQSQREARVGFGGTEPSHHLSPPGPPGKGVVGAGVLAKQSQPEGSGGFGETNPTLTVVLMVA
jgi:hypothetical protein